MIAPETLSPTPLAPLTEEKAALAFILAAHLRTMGPRKRKTYLRHLFDVMNESEGCENVVRIRGRDRAAAVAETLSGARDWTRAAIAAVLASEGNRLPD